MSNFIQSNPSATSARRYLGINSKELTKSQNQLSSGLLTYDPSDLPAASAIGIQFQADLQVIAQVSSNATQASALAQLGAGTLQASNEVLTRMNTLAAQANSDSVGSSERQMFNLEYQALMAQLDTNAAVEWRGTQLFKGTLEGTGVSSTGASVVNYDRNGKLGVFSEDILASSDIFKSGTVTSATVTANGDTAANHDFSVVIGGTTYSATNVTAASMNSATSADSSYITLSGDSPSGRTETIRLQLGSGKTSEAADDSDNLAALDADFKRLFGVQSSANATVFNSAGGSAGISGIRPDLSTYFSTASVSSYANAGANEIQSVAVSANATTPGNYDITIGVNDGAGTADWVLTNVSSTTLNSGGSLTVGNTTAGCNAQGAISITLREGLDIGSAGTAANVTSLQNDLRQFLGLASDGTAGTIDSSGSFRVGEMQEPNNLVSSTTYFAGSVDTVKSTGLISGTASSASVTASGSNFNYSIKIGNETFTATNQSAPSHDGTYNGGQLMLTGENSGAQLYVDYKLDLGASPTAPSAAQLDTAFKTLFGVNAGGTAATFASGSTGLYKGTSLEVSPTTTAGAYSVSYAYSASAGLGTFTLNDGANAAITKTVSTNLANGNQVDFGNGIKLNFDNVTEFDVTRNKDQMALDIGFNSANAINLNFQTGLKSTDSLTLTFEAADSSKLSLTGTNILTQAGAQASATAVSTAINTVNQQIAGLGSKKSQLDFIVKNLSISSQNLTAAKATFTDTDIASALADAQKFRALVDVSTSVFQDAITKEGKLANMVQSALR